MMYRNRWNVWKLCGAVFVLTLAIGLTIIGCDKSESRYEPTGPAVESLTDVQVPEAANNAEDPASDPGWLSILMGTPAPDATPVLEVTPEPTPEPTPEVTPVVLPAGVIVSESLKDGLTTGYYESATLTAEGLQFHGGDAFLRYSIPTTANGYIEFSAKGFEHDELHGGTEFKSMLFSMWSGDHEYMYETAPYAYELRKFGAIIGHWASNALDLRLIADHDWNEAEERVILFWNPDVTYRFRIEWGHEATAVYRDGELTVHATYRGDFAPTNHQVQIGANLLSPMPTRRREAPYNLLISDVLICTL